MNTIYNEIKKFNQNIKELNYIKLLIVCSLASIFTTGCIKDKELEFNDVPVVESYLSENKPFSLQITRKTPYDENVSLSEDDINNLQVRIIFNNQVRIIPSVGEGFYTDPSFFPKEGITYQLEFSFNKQTVSSSTQIPSKPENFKQSTSGITIPTFTPGSGPRPGGINMPSPVKLTWKNDDQSYYMIVTETIESNPVSIYQISDSLKIPKRIFRNEPLQANQTEIAAMNFQYFGRHRLILFHLNADYASLYKNTGITSQNLTNPVTNVQNGLGIFTGINSDTLYINVLKE